MSSKIIISLKNTEILGKEEISWHGKKYYSFLGIPYAEPPIGDLRFLPPKPLENYPKHVDATEFKSGCIQHASESEHKGVVIGSEDCLYLNIFIPKLPAPDTLLPVAVLFNGGCNQVYSANRFTPTLLIEYGFIIVTFDYRLHVLGFLNLGLPDCPGNVGLKDQLCVLQWVKKNIKYFGGDPNNITLHGISSGASAVHMIIMSPLFKNLCNKAILCGGHALNCWNYNPSPLKLAFKLGQKLGYEGSNKETLLNLLKSVPAKELLAGAKKIYLENLENPCSYSFQPSIEYIKEGAFLPDSQINLWKNVSSMSIIYGINENEGMYFLKNAEFQSLTCQYEKLKLIIADLTSVGAEYLENMFKEIISFYEITENDDQENFNAVQKLLTDLILKDYYTTFDCLHKFSDSYSVFKYKFMYCGENNILKKMWEPRMKWKAEGTFHADEYGYIYVIKEYNLSEADMKTAHTISTLWSNFIKHGNPNGEILDKLWLPSTKKMPSYLEIDENVTIRNESFNSERAEFWKYLSSKYFL